jgi:hypothetical protein
MRSPRVLEMQPAGNAPSWRRTCRWPEMPAAALRRAGAAEGRTEVEGGMVGIPTAAASGEVARRRQARWRLAGRRAVRRRRRRR